MTEVLLAAAIRYLSEGHAVPINGLFFDVVKGLKDETLIVRNSVLSDEEQATAERRRGRGGITDEELRAIAGRLGTLPLVRPILDSWESMTTRSPRPERKRYWTLGAYQKGTRVVARLYPNHSKGSDQENTAWLKVEATKLAADTNNQPAEHDQVWTDANLPLGNDGWLRIQSTEAASNIVSVLRGLYDNEPPPQPPASGGTGESSAPEGG